MFKIITKHNGKQAVVNKDDNRTLVNLRYAVHECIKINELSSNDLSHILNVNHEQIDRFLTGDSRFNTELPSALCSFFNLDESDYHWYFFSHDKIEQFKKQIQDVTLNKDHFRDSITFFINKYIEIEKTTTGWDYQQNSFYIKGKIDFLMSLIGEHWNYNQTGECYHDYLKRIVDEFDLQGVTEINDLEKITTNPKMVDRGFEVIITSNIPYRIGIKININDVIFKKRLESLNYYCFHEYQHPSGFLEYIWPNIVISNKKPEIISSYSPNVKSHMNISYPLSRLFDEEVYFYASSEKEAKYLRKKMGRKLVKFLRKELRIYLKLLKKSPC